ncbi:MAG: NAD(P)-dependent oxidoreductase [Elusimicrobia bacterium]|nr:NAD(P)-dependent oxidoreductase [Elusimicrobiota bacterium]
MVITPSSRIYIAGCGGMLGDAVYKEFSDAHVKATDINLCEPWLSRGDVRDPRGMRESIEAFKPDAIINLAAHTDLEHCEREQEDAWLTNAFGAENLGSIAQGLGIPYVYISTAGIFGGEKEFYNDFDAPNPLSIYAKSKYYGEQYALRSVSKHYVFRAGWMMGGGPAKDKKFVNKIFKQIAAGRKTLEVVDDKLGTPTYTVDFARGIRRLLESGQYGLYNQVCGGSGSRYDVAVEFVRLLGLERTVSVERVSSERFQREYFAQRPASESLVNMKLNQRGLNVMRDWRECLKDYAETYRMVLETA